MRILGRGVARCGIPESALLNAYAQSEKCYTDCYVTEIASAVTLPDFIEAFYTTRLFKLERAILKYAASKPSTDSQARQLATAATDQFAAWRVEDRTENQLLMCDVSGRTRSWFMIAPSHENPGRTTRLFFGSAVIPAKNKKTGEQSLGYVFSALLGFHKLYSKALLSAAKSRLDL